jgi:hypothetical protein
MAQAQPQPGDEIPLDPAEEKLTEEFGPHCGPLFSARLKELKRRGVTQTPEEYEAEKSKLVTKWRLYATDEPPQSPEEAKLKEEFEKLLDGAGEAFIYRLREIERKGKINGTRADDLAAQKEHLETSFRERLTKGSEFADYTRGQSFSS